MAAPSGSPYRCTSCQGMNIETLTQIDDAKSIKFRKTGLRSLHLANFHASTGTVNGSDRSAAAIRNETVARKYPFRHLNIGSLKISAQSCRLCEVIERDLRSAIDGTPGSGVEDTWTVHIGLALEPGPLGPRLQLLAQSDSDQVEPISARLLVYTVEDDPTISLGFRPLRALPHSTDSSASYETARKWISDCIHEHRRDEVHDDSEQKSQLSDGVRPRHLVYVTSSGADISLRLIDGSDIVERYAALSHCWGPGPWTWGTLKDNLCERQNGFAGVDLPPTIRDACFSALKLNIFYIWIDCLCIVQDDEEDWAFEAPRMASIYHGAMVTIAATAARNSQDGLFNTKSSSPLPHPDALEAVEATLSTGSKSTLIFVPRTAWRDGFGLYEGSPLLRRAWVCQERMCSRRILHFAGSQLFWECEHCLMSEDNTHQGQGNTDFYRPRQMILSLYRSTDPFSAQDMERICGHWYEELIWLYSQSGLTFARDKLIAISGLAKVIQDRTGMLYYAGHWFGSKLLFLESLLWYRTGPGSKSSTYRAPSWSWASQDTSVGYSWTWHGGDTYGGSMYSCAKVERISVVPKHPSTTPFGLIEGGDVVLTGYLSHHKLRHCDESADEGDEYVITVGCESGSDKLDSEGFPNDAHVDVLVIMSSKEFGIRYLLLMPVRPGSDVFKRVGVGETEPMRRLEETGDEKKISFARDLIQAPMQTVTII